MCYSPENITNKNLSFVTKDKLDYLNLTDKDQTEINNSHEGQFTCN